MNNISFILKTGDYKLKLFIQIVRSQTFRFNAIK